MDVSTAAETAPVLDFRALIAELASFERAALVVLAATPAPMNRTEWMRQLRMHGVRKPSSATSRKAGKYARGGGDVEVSTGDLATLVERVGPYRLLVESSGGSYACAVAVQHALLDDPSARDLLERMRAGLRRVEPPAYAWRPLIAGHAAGGALGVVLSRSGRGRGALGEGQGRATFEALSRDLRSLLDPAVQPRPSR